MMSVKLTKKEFVALSDPSPDHNGVRQADELFLFSLTVCEIKIWNPSFSVPVRLD